MSGVDDQAFRRAFGRWLLEIFARSCARAIDVPAETMHADVFELITEEEAAAIACRRVGEALAPVLFASLQLAYGRGLEGAAARESALPAVVAAATFERVGPRLAMAMVDLVGLMAERTGLA